MMDPFTVDGTIHTVSDISCDVCWKEPSVHEDCGGLIHTEFGDENADGDYWLYYKCDKCGETSF